MKNVAPKILDSAAKFYPDTFQSLNAGCTFTLDSFPVLYRRAMWELKGRFKGSELYLILDVHNSHMMTPSIVGAVLYQQCLDAIQLEDADAKWDVDEDEFLNKLTLLTSFQAACLEIWASGYWASWSIRHPDGEMVGYIQDLLE